ncbi:MAG: response regulator transcription factor [Firmicutes bacterium]|nr:response regulator transcription factor [Bacillota bacterium]
MNEKVLIVDDEAPIVELVDFTLRKEGLKTLVAYDGKAAIAKTLSEKPDLVLLDLMLPEISGYDVFRSIRSELPVPIIMLTAKSEVVDRVVGLELGADDYITKPFSPRELAARVKAVLRRCTANRASQWEGERELRVGELRLDPRRRMAWRGDEKLELTRREYELLAIFMANHGIVLTREVLLEKVWGYDYAGDARTVDVHVARLRRRIGDDPVEPEYIITVRGVGYKMKEAHTPGDAEHR